MWEFGRLWCSYKSPNHRHRLQPFICRLIGNAKYIPMSIENPHCRNAYLFISLHRKQKKKKQMEFRNHQTINNSIFILHKITMQWHHFYHSWCCHRSTNIRYTPKNQSLLYPYSQSDNENSNCERIKKLSRSLEYVVIAAAVAAGRRRSFSIFAAQCRE